nr:CHAD domain-containing protein [Desulfocapsaceae bacterium]
LQLVQDMETNYSGVLADIDLEFLHDFRVAMRRTRSYLSQFKKSFSDEEMLFVQSELKWLGSLTGPVRDLDVYLLDKPEYMSMLPTELHPGLEEFFIDLSKQRFQRLEEMRKGLLSDRYVSFMRQWKMILENLENKRLEGQISSSEQLCRHQAIKKIRKRFTRILKDGGQLSSQSPDEDLHRLRIQGKKLRYLLEFFSSFFVEEEVEYFRKQLKKLQNNLGDFNDVSVQLEMLTQSRHGLTGRSKRSVAIAAAIGGLITHLSEKHEKIRKNFEEVFDAFASKENVKKFHNIFS